MARNEIKTYAPGNLRLYVPFMNHFYRGLQEAQPTSGGQGYKLAFSDISIILSPEKHRELSAILKGLDREDGKEDNHIGENFLIDKFNRRHYNSRQSFINLTHMAADVRGPARHIAHIVGNLLQRDRIFKHPRTPQTFSPNDDNEFEITLFTSLSHLNSQALENLANVNLWPQESLRIYFACWDPFSARSRTDRESGEQEVKINLCYYSKSIPPDLVSGYQQSTIWHERAHRILKMFVRDNKYRSIYHAVQTFAKKQGVELFNPSKFRGLRGFRQMLEEAVDLGLAHFYSQVRIQVKEHQLKYWVRHKIYKEDGEINVASHFYETFHLMHTASQSALAHILGLDDCEQAIDEFAGIIYDPQIKEYSELKKLFVWAQRLGQSEELRAYIRNNKEFSGFLKAKKTSDGGG